MGKVRLHFLKGNTVAIVWTSDLDTGIDVIDNQHKRIVDYINQLESAVRQNDRAAVGAVLSDLVDYTISHFAFEENLQEEAGYMFVKPHKSVHEMFIKRVSRFQEKHYAGDDVAQQLHTMLVSWLVDHIKRDDMAYVSAVKEKMLAVIATQEASNKVGWLKRFFK